MKITVNSAVFFHASERNQMTEHRALTDVAEAIATALGDAIGSKGPGVYTVEVEVTAKIIDSKEQPPIKR